MSHEGGWESNKVATVPPPPRTFPLYQLEESKIRVRKGRKEGRDEQAKTR